MRLNAWNLVAAAALLTLGSCSRQPADAKPITARPSESVQQKKRVPVLPIAGHHPADLPKGNQVCLVCHMNFAENDSIAGHVAQEITCMHCHGMSEAHMNDESSKIPPDVLWGRLEVDSLCTQCHESPHENPKAVEAFVEKWSGDKRENGRNVTAKSICTDCHGMHTNPRR